MLIGRTISTTGWRRCGAFASGAAPDVSAVYCRSVEPGDRKSVLPMAARVGDVGYCRLLGPLVVAGGDGAVVLQLVEEAFDEVPVAIQEGAEGRLPLAVRLRLDVRPGPPLGEAVTQGVAVVGTVGEQDLPLAEVAQHVGGAPAVVRLALGELQRDRRPLGIDERMDFGRQAVARATHATGPVVFSWALAAC